MIDPYNKLSLIDILTTSPTLGEIVNKVEQLAKLNRIVQQKLDPQLKKHCRVANLREGILILSTPSPAFGNLLRFEKISLLTSLRTDPSLCHLKAIEIKVQPPTHALLMPERPKHTRIPTLSKVSAEFINNTALTIHSSSLRTALLRLSTIKPHGN